MLSSIVSQILFTLRERDQFRQNQTRKRKHSSGERPSRGKRRRRVSESFVRHYIDDEAIESDCDGDESCMTTVEAGFGRSLYDDQLLDPQGQPYLIPVGKSGRLFKVISTSYDLLSPQEKREVAAKSLRFSRVSSTF